MSGPHDGETAPRRHILRHATVPLGAVWRQVPATVRKAIVFTVGTSIALLGVALVVLPGPFTLPLLLLGFVILGTEFAWAAVVLEKTRRHMEKAGKFVKRTLRRK